MPPDPFARRIIGNTGEGENSVADDLSVGKRSLYDSIRRQPVHTGAEGLNLPELPTDASDRAIKEMQRALAVARKIVADRRGQLADDVHAVIRQAETSG